MCVSLLEKIKAAADNEGIFFSCTDFKRVMCRKRTNLYNSFEVGDVHDHPRLCVN